MPKTMALFRPVLSLVITTDNVYVCLRTADSRGDCRARGGANTRAALLQLQLRAHADVYSLWHKGRRALHIMQHAAAPHGPQRHMRSALSQVPRRLLLLCAAVFQYACWRTPKAVRAAARDGLPGIERCALSCMRGYMHACAKSCAYGRLQPIVSSGWKEYFAASPPCRSLLKIGGMGSGVA